MLVGLISVAIEGDGGISSTERRPRGGVVARKAVDVPVGRHHADPGVPRVGNVDISGVVRDHAGRCVERGVGGQSAVSSVALAPIAGDGGDGSARRHHADDVIAGVGDQQVAARVESDRGRGGERGRGGRAVIAAAPGLAGAGELLITPLVPTTRTRLSAGSAMYRLPAASTARDEGEDMAADLAGPPSPLEPSAPLPATSHHCLTGVDPDHLVRAFQRDEHIAVRVGHDRGGRVQKPRREGLHVVRRDAARCSQPD